MQLGCPFYCRPLPHTLPHHLPTVNEEELLMSSEQPAEPNLAEVASAAMSSVDNSSSGDTAQPSRVLLVRHVAGDASDAELQDIFQVGGLQSGS
jgi:hypothetical protein